MTDLTLLLVAFLVVATTGVLLGIHIALSDPHDGLRALSRRAVEAERTSAYRLTVIDRLEAERDAHSCTAPLLTGGPGPARANHHGGLTVIPSPAETSTAGAIHHLPQHPQGASV